MAEEKKPKIDLKARLGKTGLNPVAQVTGPGGIPAPAVSSGNNIAPSSASNPPRGLPVPPGIPVGPPPAFGKATPGTSLDPSNPLAAAVAPPYRAPAPPPPPQPQRIEVDEVGVQTARKSARRQGVIIGLVIAVIVGAVGFIAGGAQETNKGRQQSVGNAKSLAADVGHARDQLKTLADKVDNGRATLIRDHKFPDTLAKELGGINVDFDGTKLAGVRFSGFSTTTTSGLIEFITSVQQINDRKLATINLLTHLQKPITESLSGTQKQTINFVVLLGGPKDPAGNPFGVLAALSKPLDVPDPTRLALPTEFQASNPLAGGNVTAPKYTAGPIDKPTAVYLAPKSLNAACPSETTGQIAQLGSQLTHFVDDIRGVQAAAGGDAVTDSKPGLLERADTLVTGLNRVQ